MTEPDLILAMECPNCGHWQGRSIINPRDYVFRCDRCKKTRKLLYENAIGFQVNYQRFLKLKEAIGYAVDQNGKDTNIRRTSTTAKSL